MQTAQRIRNPFMERCCKTCAHIRICSVFRAIAPLISSFKENQPFNTEDLAMICREYVNGGTLALMKSGGEP